MDRREQDPSQGARNAHAAGAQPEPRSILNVRKHLQCQAPQSGAPSGGPESLPSVKLRSWSPTSCAVREHVMHFGEYSAALDS